jgi:hypothetical protein
MQTQEQSSGTQVSLKDLESPAKVQPVKVEVKLEGSPQGTPSKRLREKTKVEDVNLKKSKGDHGEKIRAVFQTSKFANLISLIFVQRFRVAISSLLFIERQPLHL